MTRVRGQRKPTTDTPSLKCEGFISRKLQMTKDNERIFVEYILGAVVHIIYIYCDGILSNIITIEIFVFHTKMKILLTKCSRNMSDEVASHSNS